MSETSVRAATHLKGSEQLKGSDGLCRAYSGSSRQNHARARGTTAYGIRFNLVHFVRFAVLAKSLAFLRSIFGIPEISPAHVARRGRKRSAAFHSMFATFNVLFFQPPPLAV